MKRSVLACVMGLVLVMGLAGCAGQPKKAEVNAIAAAVMEKVKFSEQLTEIDKETACGLYEIPESEIETCKAYIGSGGTVDEAFFFEGKDASKLEELKRKAQARIAAQKASYQSYKPSEVPKLDKAVLVVKGSCLIVCITADENAKSVIDKA